MSIPTPTQPWTRARRAPHHSAHSDWGRETGVGSEGKGGLVVLGIVWQNRMCSVTRCKDWKLPIHGSCKTPLMYQSQQNHRSATAVNHWLGREEGQRGAVMRGQKLSRWVQGTITCLWELLWWWRHPRNQLFIIRCINALVCVVLF